MRTEVDGIELSNERIDLSAVGSLPREFRVRATSPSSTRATVRIEGFPGPDGSPLVRRTSTAPFVRGEVKLVRLRLESACVEGIVPRAPCGGETTCIRGLCVDPLVSELGLEPYSPAWPSEEPDSCRPVGAGAPEVIVGTGQTDYGVLATDTELQLERGPQGGHHIWVAVRMKNLNQQGSITTLSASQPDTGIAPPPASFVFTYDRDEGGYCKLFGLRFQLDTLGGMPDIRPEQYLGKPLDVTIEVKDRGGRMSRATTRIRIDPKILCPSGLDC